MNNFKSFFQDLGQKITMENAKIIINQIINYVSNLTWFDYNISKWIFLALITYIVFIFVFLFIHKWLLKKTNKIKWKLDELYDQIWYEISIVMYDFNQEAKKNWQENKLIYWAKSIIWLEKNDYISNRKKIFEDIKKLETYIWKKMISEELIKTINWYQKKLSNTDLIQKMIWWILTILTIGIYKLFW